MTNRDRLVELRKEFEARDWQDNWVKACDKWFCGDYDICSNCTHYKEQIWSRIVRAEQRRNPVKFMELAGAYQK